MTSENVDPANVGRKMRKEHGWAKAQVLLLLAFLEAFAEADTWRKRAKMLMWSAVYGFLALIAVVYWLIATPVRYLYRGGELLGHLFKLGVKKVWNNPLLPAEQAKRDIPKLPKFIYHATKNGLARIWAGMAWVWRQLTGLWDSIVGYFTGFAINDILWPGVRSLANWIFTLIPRMFGVRDTTRREQINANIVALFVMALSSLFPLTAWVLALAIIPVSMLLFAFFFRGTPAGESYWKRLRQRVPIKSDYNIPFWRGE